MSYREMLGWCVERRVKESCGTGRQGGRAPAGIAKGRENEIQRSQVLPVVTVFQQ